jgi:hypothetical protein
MKCFAILTTKNDAVAAAVVVVVVADAADVDGADRWTSRRTCAEEG